MIPCYRIMEAIYEQLRSFTSRSVFQILAETLNRADDHFSKPLATEHAEYCNLLNLQDEKLRGEVANVLVQQTSSPAGGGDFLFFACTPVLLSIPFWHSLA
jgi:hypothetical protein